MTIINVNLFTIGNFAKFDPIMLYSELPWKNCVIESIYWVDTLVLIFAMQMTWSWLLALPGCLAFQHECLLKCLTAHLKSSRNSGIG